MCEQLNFNENGNLMLELNYSFTICNTYLQPIWEYIQHIDKSFRGSHLIVYINKQG